MKRYIAPVAFLTVLIGSWSMPLWQWLIVWAGASYLYISLVLEQRNRR